MFGEWPNIILFESHVIDFMGNGDSCTNIRPVFLTNRQGRFSNSPVSPPR